MGNYVKEQYQGKEYTVTIQAPDSKTLNNMISDVKGMAKRFNMDTIKVLQKGKDPDGGYRAVIYAHNFNPFRWVMRKMQEHGKSESEKVQMRTQWKKEDIEREKEKAAKKESKRKQKLADIKYKTEIEKAKLRDNNTRKRKHSPKAERQLNKDKSLYKQESAKGVPLSYEDSKKKMIEQADVSVSYPLGGDTDGYHVLIFSNGNLQDVIVKGDLPEVTKESDTRKEAYQELEEITGYKVRTNPEISQHSVMISNRMPRISGRSPRITPPTPRITQKTPRIYR